jgi:hypothetical protein
MRLIKSALAVLVVGSLAACGSSSSSNPDLNPAVNGTWTGDNTITVPGYSPITIGSEITVAASGTRFTASPVCYGTLSMPPSGSITGTGSGNTASWTGTLACPAVSLLGCNAVVITYKSVSATLSTDQTTFTIQGSGTLVGCSINTTFSFNLVAHH